MPPSIETRRKGEAKRFDGGRARVLDLMRRSTDAPNPAMDFAIADSLIGFAESGVEQASLGCVPVSHGRIAERIYPTRPLHRQDHQESMADRRMPGFAGATARGDEARRPPRRSGSRRNAGDLRSVRRRGLGRISARRLAGLWVS